MKDEGKMIMNIAVCDDCYEDALYIKNLLGRQAVKIYSDAGRLLADMEGDHIHYDLYLLDIYIEEDISGIELAKRLRLLDDQAVVCFISTSDAFYREAFDLYAVQYLLKPVQESDLQKLLEKVSKKLIRNRERSLCFRCQGETGRIPYGRILYISSREHTLSIHCRDGYVQECKGKLNEMALQVCGDVFCRCHQSFLVNMYQVDRLSGNDLIISGCRIPISRRYYADVKRRYQEILFEEVD